MRSFGIDCELNYEGVGPTTYLFNIAARRDDRQAVRRESLSLMPDLPYEEVTDVFGNRFYRVLSPPGPFSIRYIAEVDVAPQPAPYHGLPVEPAQLPPETLVYLLPSRYCESDRVFGLALEQFCGYPTQRQCVEAIGAWIRTNIRYRIGTSIPHGSAWDVLQARTGVCRDFAHVAVALCRAMNIPTRFVTAHAQWIEPPPDFHALIECYADGQWQLFDPTAMSEVNNVVCIGKGMDAAQVPFATIYGAYRMTRMSPLIEPLGANAAEAIGGLPVPPEQLVTRV